MILTDPVSTVAPLQSPQGATQVPILRLITEHGPEPGTNSRGNRSMEEMADVNTSATHAAKSRPRRLRQLLLAWCRTHNMT
jgi:hypothetical protein